MQLYFSHQIKICLELTRVHERSSLFGNLCTIQRLVFFRSCIFQDHTFEASIFKASQILLFPEIVWGNTMKRKMFVSFILTLLLAPLANSSCDADDDCKVGTSVGSGVCQVGAAVGGVSGIAKCVGTARYTFANASCGVAAPLYGAVGAGCAGAGEVVGSACDLCASDDALDFRYIGFWYIQEIAGKVDASHPDAIEQTRALVENHLKKEAWFQQLFENDKNILLGQAKMIVLQQIGMGQLGELIHATENFENELELSQIITLYGDAFHDVRIVREKFDFLKRGPSGLIVNDISAEFFRDAALRHNTRSYDSITKIFGMLIGGHSLKEGSIYETLGDSYCKPEIHKYFVDVLVEALTMYATAMAMEGHTLSPRLTKKFNEDLVKATSAYTLHCDCGDGYRKANRGQVSTILDQLPSSSQKLAQNRRLVARMENNVMRIKMDILFAVKNFEPNKIAEDILERHSVEDMELVVASVMNKTEDELEYHDNADICVDEERNKVKTCAAFTPDSLVNGCVPPQTLDHGRFLCLEDGVTCHVVCDEGYDQRLPQTFMKCLDNAWTPLPTSFKCEVSCPYQDDLDSVLLEHKWRSQLQLAEMSEDDQRNTVIVEVEKMTGHTIGDLQGRANSGDLESLTAIANMAALLIKYSIRSSSDVKTMTYDNLRNTLIVETRKRLPSVALENIQGMTDHQLLKTFCTAHVRNRRHASTSPVPTCSGGATTLSTSPGRDMVLCKDETESTCQKDFESLCPAGWNLCTPSQFNNRNDGWNYNWEEANAGKPLGAIYCKGGAGAALHIYSSNPVLNTDQPLNCEVSSSRPGCEAFAGRLVCNHKDKSALCCAPTSTCGDGLVQQEEDCDDGNNSNMDECLNTCTWKYPGKHGLSGC